MATTASKGGIKTVMTFDGRSDTDHLANRRWLHEISGSQSMQALTDALRARYPFLGQSLPERLAILGAGAEGRRLAKICGQRGIDVVAIFDNDATKRGIAVGKHRVVPSDAIGSLDRSIPVIVASHRVLGATLTLRAMGFSVAPFALLQVVAPRTFESHMFYEGLVDDLYHNRARYLELSKQLQDEESVRVLDRILGYRLTLDAALLSEIIDWDLYGFSGLLRFDHDEVYVDGGAFDGDSVRMFIDRVNGNYERILAFEPDPQTFKKLSKNLHALPRVELFNCGLHRAKGVLRFNNDGSRGAIISTEGDFRINVVGLDEVLDNTRATFIKMNIEGAEREALRGAAKTIASWRPKLAISAYHRPSDLWEIPKLIRELDADYRLFLRQHDGGIIETVLYAVP
jgi:FkbM family methyltransferase